MNLQFANKLKEKLGIGLSEAMALVKDCGEDFERCQKAVYDKQIAQIMTQTERDRPEAITAFEQFSSVEKAIKYLNEKVDIFAVEDLEYDKPYGFQLWAEDENETILQGKYARIFVPFSHFEAYLLDDFKAVFPIENDYFEDNCFDVTGVNYFGKKEVQSIICSLKTKTFSNENEQRFVQKLIDWLTEKIAFAHEIVVYGTL